MWSDPMDELIAELEQLVSAVKKPNYEFLPDIGTFSTWFQIETEGTEEEKRALARDPYYRAYDEHWEELKRQEQRAKDEARRTSGSSSGTVERP